MTKSQKKRIGDLSISEEKRGGVEVVERSWGCMIREMTSPLDFEQF